MVVKSKPVSTAVVPDHPANDVSILKNDQIQAFVKLQPIYMPNDQIDDDHPLHALRNSWKYIYVINWLYQCRGYVRLLSEYFDVDLFECELLNMVYPPPIDDSVLFINKLKIALLSTLQGSKCLANNFEKIFRIWFGSDTPLKGPEENTEDTQMEQEEEDQYNEYPTFDSLLIEDKFEILYLLMDYITGYPQFRTFLDKAGTVVSDTLRINPLVSEPIDDHTTESLCLLFDCSRIYKRKVTVPTLVIPKKRKLAPADPESYYEPDQFDIEGTVQYELLAKGLYQIDKYLVDLSKKKNKKAKEQLSALKTAANIESLYVAETKKRKFMASRRKELQLSNLLATRKRSSRLEAKEKQRQEELRQARIEEEEELRIAAEKRMERRRLARNEEAIGLGMTREERLRMRREPTETPEAQQLDATIGDDSTPITPATPVGSQNGMDVSTLDTLQASVATGITQTLPPTFGSVSAVPVPISSIEATEQTTEGSTHAIPPTLSEPATEITQTLAPTAETVSEVPIPVSSAETASNIPETSTAEITQTLPPTSDTISEIPIPVATIEATDPQTNPSTSD